MKDYKGSQSIATPRNLSASQISVDSNGGNTDKFNSDLDNQHNDIRITTKIVFSSHGGEVDFYSRYGDIHLFYSNKFVVVN
jgi:hypothetical protein